MSVTSSKIACVFMFASLLSGCAVLIGGSDNSVPMNQGLRLDMVVSAPRSFGPQIDSWIRLTWTQSESLSSWFLIVDRIVDPETTVALEYEVLPVERDSQRVGTPKYGYTTVYSAVAEVVFSLVDVRSGVVLASASGRGSAAGERSQNLGDDAMRRAVSSGLHRLMANYTGGQS